MYDSFKDFDDYLITHPRGFDLCENNYLCVV